MVRQRLEMMDEIIIQHAAGLEEGPGHRRVMESCSIGNKAACATLYGCAVVRDYCPR